MADYYPLLAKAASALPDPSPQARAAMYERARKALLGQLRVVEPPVAQEDIDRESTELDAAIARVEADFAARAKMLDGEAALSPPEPAFVEPAPAPRESLTESQPVLRPRIPEERTAHEPGDDAADLRVRMREPQRPLAPAPPPPQENRRRLWIVAGALVAVVAVVALVALKLRDSPDDLARLKPVAVPSADQSGNGKIVDRVGGRADAGAAASSPSRASTSAPPQQSTAQSDAAQPPVSQPPIPVAQKAALLLEAPDTENKVRTFIGSVIWRLDNVPTNTGQPMGTSVHADVEIPEAKVRVSIDIRKNTDPALPAANTIEIRFGLLPGSVLPGIKQISVPQMRRQETPNGEILGGVPVKITDTYFFVGLAQGDTATRNADLLRNRGWMDFPIQLSDDRVAKLTIEKGPGGDRMIADALSSWDQ